MRTIILKPVISERSLTDAAAGVFTFLVDKSSDKNQIKNAIEEMYKVHVRQISTSIVRGKKRIVGRKRKIIHESDAKKARVKLADKEKIDLFEVKTGA